MLISAATIAIPVSTSNPPTEAVASETAKKVQIPQPTSSAESSNTRNSTENHEQPKNTLDFNRVVEQESKQNESKDGSEQQKQQKQQQQSVEKAQQAQDKKVVDQLKSRDRDVRAHETAHASAGGSLTGAPKLSFSTGPDGRRYAVSGEVSIDTSKVSGDPQGTINKMNQVRRAALAPAKPSSQDLKVAAIASQIANQSQIELNIERNQEVPFEKEGDEEISSEKQSKYAMNFANPVVAKRSSLQLNQKIADSGALDDIEDKPLLSQIA